MLMTPTELLLSLILLALIGRLLQAGRQAVPAMPEGTLAQPANPQAHAELMRLVNAAIGYAYCQTKGAQR